MPVRTTGGVFDEQILTGSLAHYVVCGADFSGAINSYGQPVPNSAAEIIFTKISEGAYINIMNPNDCNLSFALEAGRSVWDEISLTAMIQGLGNDVGVDHIDCTVCTVKQVPYVWGCGTGGVDTFLELLDTPNSYAGAAGLHVAVNPTEDGLIFVPASAGANAFSFVEVPTQPTISATGSDTITFVPGPNVIITTDSLLKTVTITSTVGADYIPVPAGTSLSVSMRYFITSSGTVTLPEISGSSTPGQSVTLTKAVGTNILVEVGHPGDVIATDLGTTDAIDYDATEELVFVISDSNTWNLQVGSAL